MKKIILLVSVIFISSTAFAQDAFFVFGFGPDMSVKTSPNSTTGTRFRMNMEVGGKHLGFVFQPSFGQGVNGLFLGPKFMLPFQIGEQALFVIPDFGFGTDFGFGGGNVGLALDMKFGITVFYEIADQIGVAFSPFKMSIRPFNVWFGDTPNQSQISVRYEMMFGMAYFF